MTDNTPHSTEIDSPATEVTAETETPAGDLDTLDTVVVHVGSTAQVQPPRRRVLRGEKLIPLFLLPLLVISGGVTTWLYFKQYRPDQQTGPSAAQAVVTAASDGTVALLSYAPDTLDKDFASARSHLSGDFLSYYNQFTEQIVAPAAKQKSMKTTAHIKSAAVSELQPKSAVVLVFVDQATTTKDVPSPSLALSSVLVSLTRVNGNWLITKFEPV